MSRQKPISTDVRTEPVPGNSQELYLDILKRILCRALVARGVERHTIRPGRKWLFAIARLIDACLSPFNLELVKLVRTSPEDFVESASAAQDRAEDAETMIGTRQLDQMQACINDVIDRSVPGDLLEAGVWRGGMTIFMQAVLRTRKETHNRRVWVADSFAGLPEPNENIDSSWWRTGDMAVSLDEVKDNFLRFGLLDSNVEFLEGYFEDTLPAAPCQQLAVLRLDADLYESTRDALAHLYPRLSPGGYAIFDDYQNLPGCRLAIDEYREAHSISDPIVRIDTRAVYWVKAGT